MHLYMSILHKFCYFYYSQKQSHHVPYTIYTKPIKNALFANKIGLNDAREVIKLINNMHVDIR